MNYEKRAAAKQAKAEKRRREEARAFKRQALPGSWRASWALPSYAARAA